MNIDQVVLEVAKGLVNCFEKEHSIVFPEYHNNGNEEYRISEQESKILFSNEFIKNGVRFAVEVPTKSKHQQKGESERSGRFDLAVYKEDTYDFDWVIELKSGNPKPYDFEKDFEKMVLSNSKCIWFHTLKNANERTFESVLGKINRGIHFEISNFEGKHIWKLIIVVLEKKELYSLDISLEKGKYDEIQSIDQFTKIERLS